MEFDVFTQVIVTGLLVGGVYGLISMGLSIIYGVLRVINFAQGDFMMLGMYAAFFIFSIFHFDPIISVILVFALFMVVGASVYRIIMHQVIFQKNKTSQLLMTFGLSFVIQNLALVFFGPTFKNIVTPYRRSSFNLGPININQAQAIGFLIAVILVILFWLFFSRSNIGIAIRAVVDDKDVAVTLGINVNRIYMIAFGIGISLAAASGATLIMYYPVFPTVGRIFQIIMFLAVMLGGLGSILGSFFGGLVVGLVQFISSVFLPSYLEFLPVYLFFFFALVLRPEGLFG